MQVIFQPLTVTTITLIFIQIEQVEGATDVVQGPSTSTSAWTHKNPYNLPSNARQGSTILEAIHPEQQMPTLVKYYEMEMQLQNLSRDNQRLQNQFSAVQKNKQELEKRFQRLRNDNRGLHNQLGYALTRKSEYVCKSRATPRYQCRSQPAV